MVKFRTIWVVSSAWLEHLPFKQGVLGSNPRRPTKFVYGYFEKLGERSHPKLAGQSCYNRSWSSIASINRLNMPDLEVR